MFSLPKSERLCGKKTIDSLFEKGDKWNCYPFRIVFWVVEDESEAPFLRFLVSVSKRNFKRAVDRNKLKRRVREAYRLNKFRLLEAVSSHSSKLKNQRLILGFLYTSKQMEPYPILEKRLVKALEEVSEKLIAKITQS